jgi:hypothetical protein
MTNEETDTALILENELKRRVKEAIQQVVGPIIREEVRKIFVEQKDSMLMEVSISVGKTLRGRKNESRKLPCDETPEEFGLTSEMLRRCVLSVERTPTQKEIQDALR